MANMAASRHKHFSSILYNFCFKNAGWSQLTRSYSQYAPIFQYPVINKDEVDNLIKKMTESEVKALRVRAAENHETCSVFYDKDLAKFINCIMRKGKREEARQQVSKAFAYIKHIQLRKYNAEKDEELRAKIELNPNDVFRLALKNATPQLMVTKVKKSGTWYHVPMGITKERAKFQAMKWLILSAKEKHYLKKFHESLGEELIASSQHEGKATKKKLELHKLCETNRSYAHYQWT